MQTFGTSKSRTRLGGLMVAALLAALVVATGQPSAGASGLDLVFAPSDDATVKALEPTVNFGATELLEVDAGPQEEDTLVRFDVTGIGTQTVQSATLRVFAVDSSNEGGTFSAATDTTWTEETVTWADAPAGDGGVLGSLASVHAGSWYEVDVSPLVTGDGPVSVRIASTSINGADYASKEHTSGNAPELVVALDSDPGTLPVFDVVRTGSTYEATAQNTPAIYTGTLKFVVERALDDMRIAGGGTMIFAAGDFDLGSEHFEINDIVDVTFEGQGMGVTTLRNHTDEAADTEPFDVFSSDRLTIRDLTVSAGGSDRSTSDALDFDGGDDIVIERVEVVDSRGRGIIFDGKDAVGSTGGTADRNIVRDCVITGTVEDGIQFLASNENLVENCTIADVGGEGIRVHRSSANAPQPNKPSNDNVIRNNVIERAAGNGIRIAGGSRNVLSANDILDNGSDGIRIATPVAALTCDDNVVEFNEVHGNRYGLNIEDPECHRTVVRDNDLSANSSGDIVDNGTDTIYISGAPPVLIPGAASITEGLSGSQQVLVPVTLTEPAGSVITVDWATSDYQAVAPDDFVAATGQLTFEVGEVQQTITVAVNGDDRFEPDEVGLLRFSNPVGATIGGFYGLGAFEILNDDPEPEVIPGVVTVVEGNGGSQEVLVPVTLSGASGSMVTVDWATMDFTASAPEDFDAANGEVQFAPGETEQTVAVTVHGDIDPELDEIGFVAFTNPTGATLGGFFGLGAVNITNDD